MMILWSFVLSKWGWHAFGTPFWNPETTGTLGKLLRDRW